MKRRYELTVGVDASLGHYDAGAREDSPDTKATRQVSKRQRIVGPGISRLNSALQDINNLSHRSTIPPNNFPKPAKLDSEPIKTVSERTRSLSRPAVPRPISEPTPLSLYGSTSERDTVEPGYLRLPPVSPRRTLSGPALSAQPNNSESTRLNSPSSRFIPQDNPVRISRLQGFQHNQNRELDSDSEDGDEVDEVTDNDDVGGPVEETLEDSAEREVVENRYADINKMLGNLFLARHRNQA
ncbi:hypothetical protein FRC07_001239 [Ceratobasidium sp. 392]|nr:hypothetical protein FRC07_001239 [Ceratobasidium sp. 392]